VSELPPLTGPKLLVTAVALALGTFMQVLDSTIANVSIPTIAGNLGVSADQGTWVITSFAVANGISVPLTGWLMQRYGAVRTFVVSVLLFTLASLLCGAAWSLPALVMFRVLQGAVSGPLIPGSQALLLTIFPREKRGSALGLWSMTTLVGPICGPILGGYISDNYSWSWIFLINVPVGLLTAAVCWRNMAGRETPRRALPVDRMGFLLLLVWVGSLQIMLDRGKDADWFAATPIRVLAIVAAIGFVAWVIWEATEEHPIVDLSLFGIRNFLLGTIVFCLGYAVFFGNNLLVPLWLQTQLGYTATWAGLVVAPSGLVAVSIAPFAARLMARVDARWTATGSFIAFTLSYFMRTYYAPDTSYFWFVMPLLVQGAGVSFFFVSMVTISLSDVPPARIPSASGLSNFARITAGSFAISITTTLWDRREALHQTRLTETASAYDPALQTTVAQLQALGMAQAQAFGRLMQEVIGQAYLLASIEFFWLSAWLSLTMIPLVWLARRSIGQGGAAAD